MALDPKDEALVRKLASKVIQLQTGFQALTILLLKNKSFTTEELRDAVNSVQSGGATSPEQSEDELWTQILKNYQGPKQ